jgi:hypothetical protein
MKIGRENEVLGENLRATLSTTNPTWIDLYSNPGHRGGKPAINRLSYGTAYLNLCNIMRKMEKVSLNYTTNSGSSTQAIP